ncbi:aldehyde dehydrogenase family protein [Flavihumibacter cheonanensis]|uniref:aldehyde dehydrogenase family protein n=1 Tax=Flavihumibacter cheonanensis TaxID=1442385 RepID=UPI001EF85306|nr:aldehyde dehydrogenase family protein [Flavihumibacter cheonanensis]MCG7754368.1 aldehyde dehydrogenase family protein [Flavihumibacter cheonanensis]
MSTFNVINPATEEVLATLDEDNQQTIQEKYNLVKKEQAAWAEVPLTDRINCIRRFDQALGEQIEKLAGILSDEVGKPIQQARNEINGARGRIAFFLNNSEKWLQDEWMVLDGATKERISYEPLGVIANISAWNYPYLVGVNVFIPALIGGNAVLYKPSEFSSLTGLAIRDLLYQSGIPENVFQVVLGGGLVGSYLLDLPLNGYYFTGSNRTGKIIASKVAEKMVPCQLELGGKDPLYVTDEVADINQVAAAALEGVVYNNGQSCCAVERIYVHEKVYDDFLKSFTEQASALKIGNPKEEGIDIGPLTRKEQLAFILNQIQDAQNKGAELIAGGYRLQQPGYYMAPAVLSNVNHSMSVMKEESFGPVIGIQKVSSDAEAIDLMKDTSYGLTAAVYTSNEERAEKILKQMNTGTVYWNCCDRVSANLPWSGRKDSGLGSTLSYTGIRAFVQPKAWHLRK